MGCTSSTEDHDTNGEPSKDGSARGQMPDSGLNTEFEYLRVLGSGGSADTSLYRERATGELVAIKLIRRPVPVVLHHHLLREITVRPPPRPDSSSYRLDTVLTKYRKAPSAAKY